VRTAIICISLTALVGCASRGPEIDCSTIHVVDYSPDFEQRLVGELKVAPAAAAWPSAIADYRAMRHALQACKDATADATH